MAHWWENYPWRMVQTNLREIDMDGMDAEQYAQDLADFGATVVNLNAAGILASYETALDCQEQSRFLTGDSLAQMVDACHKRGIKVIARCDFTKVTERLYEQHPEWAYRDAEGNALVYNGMAQVCFNSDYQKTAKIEILKEVLGLIPFDGVFFNMSGAIVTDYNGGIHGPCHCENCMRDFKKAFGEDARMPREYVLTDPMVMRYMGFTNKIAAANKAAMIAAIREINPELCIMGTDVIRSETNSDVDRPQWVLSASMNSRLGSGVGPKKTVDNASTDFAGFMFRHVSVSPAQAALRQWQNLANSGCVSFFIMGTLANHRVTSSYGPTKEVFALQAAHEDLFTHMQSVAEVLLLHDRNWQRPSEEEMGWAEVLTAAHIPYDELTAGDVKNKEVLSGKKVVIVPAIKSLPAGVAEILDAFAKEGGTVIATADAGMIEKGRPLPAPALKSLGISAYAGKVTDAKSAMFVVEDDEAFCFENLKETPYVGLGKTWFKVCPAEGARTYLGQIGEHPTGPPELVYFEEGARTGECGLVVNAFGNGQGIYIPWAPGELYMQMGLENTLLFMKDVLQGFAGCADAAPEASEMLEVDLDQIRGTKEDDGLLIQLVNLSGHFGMKYMKPVPQKDVILCISGSQLKMAGLSAENVTARTLRGGRVLARAAGDDLQLTLDNLTDYEGILLQ